MKGQECPLSLGALSVYSVYSVVYSRYPESLRTAGGSRPYLALGQGHKKTARSLSSPSFEKYRLAGLLAVTAGVLGFYGQGLFADTLAEIGQLGPAHTALAVDNHFFNAR